MVRRSRRSSSSSSVDSWPCGVPRGKAKLDALELKLPVVGDLTETAIIERTCRVLASMLRAGVDLPRSMAVTAESANNAVYRNALEEDPRGDDAGPGSGRAHRAKWAFSQRPPARCSASAKRRAPSTSSSKWRPPTTDRELETKLERATALFEPAIIIFMGVVVGFVAVALISAMYGIYNQVKVG